jgi:glycosyltransferase involved in cell wall biosynthesis
MRLALLNEFFYPDRYGGTGKVLSDLARRLADNHEYSIHAVTTQKVYRGASDPLAEHEEWDGIEITRLPAATGSRQNLKSRLKDDLRYTWRAFRKLLAMRGLDGVLVSTSPPTLPLAAWLLKKLKGIPYWYVIYDIEPDRAVVMGVQSAHSPKVRIMRWMQAAWLKDADRVIAIGRCMKDRLIDSYDLDADSIQVIPVGEDSEAIRPTASPDSIRREFGASSFVVLYSGNFGRYHKFDSIFDAAERLKSDPRFHFLMVGDGKKKEEIEAAKSARGLYNLHVRPFVPAEELEDLLSSADVCLVTLEPGMEGLCVPSKFYTILAAGRPALALMPSCTETALTIEEEACGWALENDDGDQLAEILIQAAADRSVLARMGINARDSVERRFSSDKIAEEFANTIGRAA